MFRTLLAAAAIATAGGVAFAAHADHQADHADDTVIQLADYLDYETVANPQISPDGRQVIYTRNRIDKVNDKRVSTLWVMDRDGGRNRQLMEGGGAFWSPSGDRIAFMKPDADGNAQIFVRYMDGEGLVTQVTSFEHAPRSMAWSPDGEHIAFVARTAVPTDWTIDLPARPQGAKWTEDPVVVDDLHYRQDRVGYTNTGYDHLFGVPSNGGTPRQLTEGEWNVGQRGIGVIAGSPTLSWSPDGTHIAFDGPGKPIEPPHWFESHINLVNVDTGETRTLTDGRGVFGSPAFSPDGAQIAFNGYPEHNTSYPVPNLYTIDVESGARTTLAEDLPDGPGQIHWSPNGRRVVFTMNDRGARNIHSVDLRGRMRDETQGAQMISLASLSNDGRAAFVVTDTDSPAAVAVADELDGSPSIAVLTDVNADIFHGKTLGRVEEVWYEATAETGESADVQGWIVYPPNYVEGEKYPLLLSIHGGPHAMYNTAFNFTFQEFAARGYVVLYVNPRGSTGYGSEFANAIRHRYPGPVDYADLMAGVDLVVDRGIVDPDRMFVTGCSGGGVLTTWVIGQTDRFKAAAALCPVVNWIGMSGTTDVVGWLYGFFPEPFWEDPQPWLDHSTIMHVGKVSTPTLLMTGVEDLRTPLGEAEEYFAALKIRGVPTKLIPMIGEYHGTRSIPSNYLRTSLYMRKWFDQFDPAKSEADDEDEDDEATAALETAGD
ncbi:MAG: S9 family peptidase [Pseudomonadota bacterium]